jgi:hypothetical protein
MGLGQNLSRVKDPTPSQVTVILQMTVTWLLWN